MVRGMRSSRNTSRSGASTRRVAAMVSAATSALMLPTKASTSIAGR
jgi:hypothetical protein